MYFVINSCECTRRFVDSCEKSQGVTGRHDVVHSKMFGTTKLNRSAVHLHMARHATKIMVKSQKSDFKQYSTNTAQKRPSQEYHTINSHMNLPTHFPCSVILIVHPTFTALLGGEHVHKKGTRTAVQCKFSILKIGHSSLSIKDAVLELSSTSSTW